MAATCDIYPQVRSNGKLVDSILFTDLLSHGIKRKDAIDIYTKIFTTAFKREHGDWENFPSDYEGGLDANGQPSVESILTSPFFSSITSAKKGKGLGEFTYNLDYSNSTIDVNELRRIPAGGVWDYLLENTSGDMHNLIKRLRDATPKGIRKALVIDTYPHPHQLENGMVVAGLYHSSPDGDRIISLFDTVKQTKEDVLQTLLHELVHATTLEKMYANKDHPNIKELEDFLARIKEYPQFTQYGFTNIYELVAEAYTNPKFQEQLAKITSVFKGGSLLLELAGIIKKILGINEHNNTTALDFVFDKTFFLFDNAHLSQEAVPMSVTAARERPAGRATLDEIQAELDAQGLYLDEKENVYKHKNGDKTIYRRLTEWVDTGFSKMYHELKMTSYEANAYKMFKNKNLDTATGKLAVKDELGVTRDYTYKQLVEHERMMQNTKGRIYGNIVHAMIQDIIKPSAETKAKIATWIAGIPGESYPQNPKDFEWVEGSIAKIFAASGINVFNKDAKNKDKLAPELIVASKLLGIATSIDNLIQHADGNFSIIDWKTGGLFSDKLVATYMRYGRNQVTNITDTKLNRAKLEVVLRAMLVKESMGDKSISFNNLKIVHMDKKGRVSTSKIDIVPFLGLIESYYKDSENKKLDEYEQLKAKGLFDPQQYMGSNRNLESDLIDEVPSVAMEKLLGRLTKVRNAMRDNKTKAEIAELEDQETALVAEIGTLKSQNLGYDFNVDGVEDMGTFKRWFGNKYSSNNPKIKAFFAMLDERKDRARSRINAIYDKHDELLRPILEKYYTDHNMKGMLQKSTKVLLGGINGLQYQEVFDFMWERVDEGDVPGYYARIIEHKNGKYTDGVRDFTKEQYEYNKWYRETMATNYKKVASRIGLYRGSRAITVGDMMGKPDELSERFMPRYMLNGEEIIERYGFLSKEHLAYQRDSVLSDFTEQEYNINNDQHGIPLKYLGNKSIIESENHTLSAELAFKNFIANVIMKDELDDVHSFGSGVINMLQDQTDAGTDMSNSIDFLKDQIYLHVLDIKKPTKWSRKGFTFPVRNKDGSMGTRTVSIDKVMRILKSWVSAQAMWVKPIAGGINAALIFMLQLNKAAIGSLAKAMGVPPEQLDFTLSDLLAAQAAYNGMIKDMMHGKKEENKMWQFAKHMNYLPDNYDYAIRKGELMAVKNKLFDKSNLYLFHSIGEEYGSFMIMAAQLHRYQMNGKSAWEQHEIKDGKLVYIGGKRGNLDDGTELHGLSSLEMNKFKRVSAKIHGGYRQDERTALELTALGQWALQFRKYLPNVLENLAQGKYEDLSIGNYEMKKNDKNEDVYQWVARINEGRVRVIGKFIFTMMGLRGDDDYKWSNMKPEQQLQVYEVMVAGSMWALMTALHAVMFTVDDDDDDEDEITKAWRIRSKRLIDDTTQGLAFWDLLSSLQNQTSVLPKLYKTANASYDFLFRGVVMGEKTQRGDMVGENTIDNSIPFFTTIGEKQRYFGSSEDKE